MLYDKEVIRIGFIVQRKSHLKMLTDERRIYAYTISSPMSLIDSGELIITNFHFPYYLSNGNKTNSFRSYHYEKLCKVSALSLLMFPKINLIFFRKFDISVAMATNRSEMFGRK